MDGQRRYRLTCLVALAVGCAGAAVGAVRWIGPATWAHALAPLGRAPLFVGTVAPILAYALVQALPGGREPLWLPRAPSDGWSLALCAAMLCAALGVWPARPGPILYEVLASAPMLVVSAGFFADRQLRVRRMLAAPT
ncbi:hypothetical protein [Roseisolibacter sp. H3M3-2]|uniref:hypothetical protein n=1 Tax=Roseisolibacter sp. H3M3-2 TaxID=3031323 RepID=UPI0023DB1645|nr:hypothetical protein [Roseisolibacter sp. H3M3-2]MDF1505762.1 hypothetical protein [Roseisolibacter sp. H3M3-2]